jgi:glycosyltransferase involved in cell wall biosynthesis
VKVALDVSSAPAQLAGAGRYMAELARRLPAAGVETTLVCRRGDGLRWAERSLDATVAPLVPRARVARLAYEATLLGVSEPARWADVWHGPHYTMPHRGSTPTVVTIHDLTYFTNPEWHERSKVLFFSRAITYAASHAKVLVAVSDFTARQLEGLFEVHAPIVTAPHGVDLERFSSDSRADDGLFRAHHLATGVPYVFFVGTAEPRKGLDVLLAAFSEISQTDPRIELWIAGQAGWGLSEYEAALAHHVAASRIRRLGFVSDEILPAMLRQSRVVAYPSRGEGFGLPVLEAMACGASVVTSADTVMADVAGDAATLVQVGDVEGLVVALGEAIQLGGTERSARAQRSRARAELFTWERSLDQHRRAYELAMKAG